jgi:hypothetical protein
MTSVSQNPPAVDAADRLGRDAADCRLPQPHHLAAESSPGGPPKSLLAARGAYVMPETGALIKPGRKLGDEYQAANLPVVNPEAL